LHRGPLAMSALPPLLEDKRTQRGGRQIDVNDPQWSLTELKSRSAAGFRRGPPCHPLVLAGPAAISIQNDSDLSQGRAWHLEARWRGCIALARSGSRSKAHHKELAMHNAPREGDSCRKCGAELRSILCARCYGTGKSGKRDCKACCGTGVTIGCPNFRSHRIWPWNAKARFPSAA
jgi:hypothetical protein